MAKGKKSVFFCQNCGHEEAKWLGQCPGCGEWNTFVEETDRQRCDERQYVREQKLFASLSEKRQVICRLSIVNG